MMLLVMLLTTITAWAQSPSGNWEDYKATSLNESEDHNTIYISTAEELALYAYNVNHDIMIENDKYYCARTVELQANIDLSAHYWKPIGYNGAGMIKYYFNGKFNGNGHTISGLYLDRNDNHGAGTYVGFFGVIEGTGWIKDLIIDNFRIDTYSSEGLAALVSHCMNVNDVFTIENCIVKNGYINNSYSSTTWSKKGEGVFLGSKNGAISVINNFYVNVTGNYGGAVKDHDVDGATVAYASAQSEFCKKITVHNEDYYYRGDIVISVGPYDYTGSNISVTPTVTFDGTALNSDCYTVSIKNSQNETITQVKDAGIYTLTITGVNNKGYYGSKSTSFYVLGVLNGNGTENSPYEIYNLNDWRTFSLNVSLGQRLDKYYILKDNISGITEMVGDANYQFCGSFDGNQKTLTVNINETATQGTAPFREISGATIKNLTVMGSVTGTTHTAGLVGFARSGVNTIENCNVAVNVSVPATSGNRHMGGIVGHGFSSTLNLVGCVFSGTMSNSGDYAGGMQGWSDGNTLTITNCLFMGSYTGTANNGFHPIAIHNVNSSTKASVSNCYYTVAPTLTNSSLIATTGKQVRSVLAGDTYVTTCEASPIGSSIATYNVSGITVYNNGITCGSAYYYGNGDQVNLSISHGGGCEGYKFSSYTASAGTLSGSANPYTFTMPNEDVMLYAKWTPDPAHFADNGDGSYTIKTATGWSVFCDALQDNDTYNRFSGKTVKLGGDIGTEEDPVTRMAGSSGHDFKGTFDGDGKTLTVDYNATENYAAPFRNAESGCVIENLIVEGSIATSAQFAAGIVGNQFGTVTIRNCRVSATISSSKSGDGTHGGFVGVKGDSNSAHLTIEGCVFDGKIVSTGTGKDATTKCGGFVGWRKDKGSLTIINCLYAPRTDANAVSSGATFARNGGTITNCYYTQTLDEAQGAFAYIAPTAPANLGAAVTDVSYTVLTAYEKGILFDGKCYVAPEAVTFYDNAANDLTSVNGYVADVTLQGRTLYKDGKWNTICLPFAMTAEQIAANSNFAGATLMTLDVTEKNGFDTADGTLYLWFKSATEIEAGVPYLVKWTKAADYEGNEENYDISNPVFEGVTISNTAAQAVESTTAGLEIVEMVGNYSPVSVTADDKSILFLSDANTLYYSSIDRQIRSCRAYFSVPYIKGNAGAKVCASSLNFDSDEATGIISIENGDLKIEKESDGWYDLNGRRLNGKPTAKGLYIHNGRKEVVE
jgi:hypothetical protein